MTRRDDVVFGGGGNDEVTLVANFSDKTVEVPVDGVRHKDLLHTHDEAPAAVGKNSVELPAWGYAVLG